MTIAAVGGAGPDPRLKGIGLMLIAGVFFAGLDTCAKLLGATLPAVEVAWLRYVVHIGLTVIVLRPWRVPALLRTNRLGLQIVRSICLLGSTFFNFLALQHLQIAETTAINFACPLVITALAGPMLGEWAGRRRWIAVGVGFIGVLIVIRPGSGALAFEAIYSLCSMLCNAVYAIYTRRLAATESAQGMLLYSAMVGAIVLIPALPAVWVPPSGVEAWILIAVLGATGGIGHFCLIRAHGFATASLLAPFGYGQIIWAVASSILVFSQDPKMTTVVGAAIIIASGIYILHREKLVGGRKSAPRVDGKTR
ncbi:DMT family transporter [Segnochrobactrum spirostomi]|uniref:DMT family transporter n=1 Tax=Segnochrobactrum spirostomi TaxID=2608987 RepID=A0A6A7Y2Q3_9HYPH|nr:DMT family transporter [Segnochrobactrum spirostomi]MQT13353.1 DMT family transporter [Segnochrobactrum spirostomi]